MDESTTAWRTPPAAQLTTESRVSAVSWAAILAGAVVAAAASLLLGVIAAGLGLASVSPWAGRGLSATSATAVAGVALVVIQWLSAALGGYLTGRLRTRWVGTHTHEIFFRDTAHGLLTWAVATVAVAAIVASGATAVMGAGARELGAAASAAMPGASSPTGGSISPYDLDLLFRSGAGGEGQGAQADARAQSLHILAKGAPGEVSEQDRTYLASLVAARTGVSQAEAERRVSDDITQIKTAADSARRSGELASIFAALAMVIGAFIACVSAALGGRVRDLHP